MSDSAAKALLSEAQTWLDEARYYIERNKSTACALVPKATIEVFVALFEAYEGELQSLRAMRARAEQFRDNRRDYDKGVHMLVRKILDCILHGDGIPEGGEGDG